MSTLLPRRARARVLLLDEHAHSLVVTVLRLVERGYACESVDTILAALDAIDTFRPSVVIYEWNLRRGPGRGLAARFRARAAASSATPRIVVVSTLDEPEGFRAEEGIDAYFTKPLALNELVWVLEC